MLSVWTVIAPPRPVKNRANCLMQYFAHKKQKFPPSFSSLHLFPPCPATDNAAVFLCLHAWEWEKPSQTLLTSSYFFTGYIRHSTFIRCTHGCFQSCSVSVFVACNAGKRTSGEGKKEPRVKCCPPWWLLFLGVFVGLALVQWSTVFKWATGECLNGEGRGVCVCVEGVGL